MAVAINLTFDPAELAKMVLQGRVGTVLLNPEIWWFTPSLMLNSLFALAVAFTAAWVIVRAQSDLVAALGAVGFATVVAIKPQYLVGIAAVLGIGYVVATVRGAEPRAWRRLVVVAAAVIAPAVVFSAITAQSTGFTGIRFGTLGLALNLYLHTRTLFVVGLATIVVLLAVPAARRLQPRRLVQYAVGVVIGGVVLTVFLETTVVLLDGAQAARHATSVSTTSATRSIRTSQQALVPVVLVVSMFALAQLCGVIRGESRLARLRTGGRGTPADCAHGAVRGLGPGGAHRPGRVRVDRGAGSPGGDGAASTPTLGCGSRATWPTPPTTSGSRSGPSA